MHYTNHITLTFPKMQSSHLNLADKMIKLSITVSVVMPVCFYCALKEKR